MQLFEDARMKAMLKVSFTFLNDAKLEWIQNDLKSITTENGRRSYLIRYHPGIYATVLKPMGKEDKLYLYLRYCMSLRDNKEKYTTYVTGFLEPMIAYLRATHQLTKGM